MSRFWEKVKTFMGMKIDLTEDIDVAPKPEPKKRVAPKRKAKQPKKKKPTAAKKKKPAAKKKKPSVKKAPKTPVKEEVVEVFEKELPEPQIVLDEKIELVSEFENDLLTPLEKETIIKD
jgi:hypothetical protein